MGRFDYCKFIELDYVPMETGYMVSMRPTKGYASSKTPSKSYASTKRPSAPASNRDPFVNATHSSSSGSCKGSDCSPTKGRHQKYTSCTDNHGLRPPPPEQYLTPLQQKEVCIRHLRARLKETVDRLQDRDTEIDELRGQLSRMQEDWIEEECHRVEAQLALKDARHEIQQLKDVVETVHNSLSDAGGLSGDEGVQKFFMEINAQNHKLENLLLNMEIAQTSMAKEGEAPASVSGESPGAIPRPPFGGRAVCSCDVSPANSLKRSSTYNKLSEQVFADRRRKGSGLRCMSGDGTQDSDFVCCGESNIPSRADLLLEAAFLSEETASLLNSYSQMPHSSTYEKLCTGDRLSPFHRALDGVSSVSHPCLYHHHLYLHHLREMGIQTESCPVPTTTGNPSDLDTITEQRTFHSQACSPTSTWMSDEGEEEMDSITTITAANEPITVSKTLLLSAIPQSSMIPCSIEIPHYGKGEVEGEAKQENDEKEKETCILEKPTEFVERLSHASEKGIDLEPESLDENTYVQSRQGNTYSEQKKYMDAVEGDLPKVGCEGSLELGGCTREVQPGEIREGIPSSCSETRLELEELKVCPQTEATPDNPSNPGMSPGVEMPHTSQPKRCTTQEQIVGFTRERSHIEDSAELDSEKQGAIGGNVEPEPAADSGTVQKSYWSRHFLVDLLAVAVPMVPTVAWLCRGPVRNGQPMYHIGSLLRGCCTVALHSLRRGGGLRHYPAGGGDLGGTSRRVKPSLSSDVFNVHVRNYVSLTEISNSGSDSDSDSAPEAPGGDVGCASPDNTYEDLQPPAPASDSAGAKA
ncbi:syntaphilin [Gadus chalcogrammus]|uniref:syntaphilin n=1 Tax=Gadus chalcogrammus TaxID=1042646 RepID=UPI0024C29156|nr:syntaphilin [Gadus chalcogrammus]